MSINPRRQFYAPSQLGDGHMPLARRLRRLSALDRREEARAFLRQFFRETQGGDATPAARARLGEVDGQIKRTGSYRHTFDELEYGARVAWRNHARCIGRLYWRSLKVIDRRDVSDPDALFDHTAQHMVQALGTGKIQSTLTVFAPVTGTDLPTYIESVQTTQYAGYSPRRGKVIGDRKNIEATRMAMADGWIGREGPFDILPVSIIGAGGARLHRNLPDNAVRRVAITHDDYPGLSEMGLEWYAVPVISDMIMCIGGIDYPCAPFNGFYMATEIASRNLVDPWRYGLMEDCARALGFPPSEADPFWRDRTLTELNAAVTQSFARAGVTLIDHHTAAAQFMEFRAREKVAGRNVQADWSWIVPPQTSADTQPYHLSMEDHGAVPNFYHAWASDGRYLMPYYGDLHRTKFRTRLDRWHRKYKRWLREPWR